MPSREAKVYLEAKLKKKQQENIEIQFMIAVFCLLFVYKHVSIADMKDMPIRAHTCVQNIMKRKSGKDDYETKQAKDKGKKRRLEAKKASPSNTVICKHCGLSCHSTKAFFACQQHITTKAKLLRTNYSDKYELYARKLPLVTYVDGVFDAERSILRKEHEGFQQKVIELCRFIRDVTTRAQLFMNYYIIRSLVLGQKIINKAYINYTVALQFQSLQKMEIAVTFINCIKCQKSATWQRCRIAAEAAMDRQI
ncbi:hypothetical protein BDF20DRAFT_840597 [Mycotypha africana]|uniref:uncharacterized protein n=1 Tax=Mycotypha africana TaxID=64632 RepID=UPI0022FFD203|nr:uncharacterized protein BDF20DRAFT_840597 [Mycotypha africana]KAI8966936.1 hypothetical protein BDF20DRAFT_840597 [Mycotypha africana]